MGEVPVLEIGNGSGKENTISEAQMAAEAALTLNSLSEQEQKTVVEFMEKIDISDNNVVMSFGASAQAKIAQFSDSVLQNVKTNDVSVVGKSLSGLVVEIKSFDSTTEDRGGLFKLFNGAKSMTKSIDKMLTGYNKVETNIDKIVSALEGHQKLLMKDIAILDSMYENNHEYFKELSMYIIAGDEKLKQFKEVDIKKQEELAKQSGDEMETQKLSDMVALCTRFEKKLHDLKLSRSISIQMAPQIRMLQSNDVALVEKIQSSIVNSIPLWKNQIVISLGIANSKAALSAQKKVTDMTNDLLLKNSEMLKQGSIEVAKESERSIISIETIRKTNENLISTINEILDIQQKGTEQRQAAEIELFKIEGDLKQALLEASTKNIK